MGRPQKIPKEQIKATIHHQQKNTKQTAKGCSKRNRTGNRPSNMGKDVQRLQERDPKVGAQRKTTEKPPNTRQGTTTTSSKSASLQKENSHNHHKNLQKERQLKRKKKRKEKIQKKKELLTQRRAQGTELASSILMACSCTSSMERPPRCTGKALKICTRS